MTSETRTKIYRVVKIGLLTLFVLSVGLVMYQDPRVVTALGETFGGWILYSIVGLPLGIAAVWVTNRLARKRTNTNDPRS